MGIFSSLNRKQKEAAAKAAAGPGSPPAGRYRRPAWFRSGAG